MALAWVLALVLLAGVTEAAPSPRPSPSARGGGCVHGAPARAKGYEMQYQHVKPPSRDDTHGFVVDQSWVQRHATVGSSIQLSLGDPFIPYGEFKCQHSCNSTPGCVAFATYESDGKGSPPKFECHFFDSLISPEDLVRATESQSRVMTHAFNKVCDK